MAGYVCTIAGGKGGVGKTTTAINLAAGLEERGHDVAVVDADLGMANLGEMLGITHERSVHDVLAGDATVDEALTDARGGITVVPGDQRLEAFVDADPANLREVVSALRDTHDAVLVDTGAGLSHETTVPLGLADGVVLCTTPDGVAVGDTVKTADLAGRVDGEIVGGLVVRVTRDTDVADVADEFGFPLLGVIPDDPAAAETEPLVLEAPDSDAAAAYRQLSELLEGVFFDDANAGELDRVFEESWFVDGEAAEEVDENEESGGVFGLFR